MPKTFAFIPLSWPNFAMSDNLTTTEVAMPFCATPSNSSPPRRAAVRLKDHLVVASMQGIREVLGRGSFNDVDVAILRVDCVQFGVTVFQV